MGERNFERKKKKKEDESGDGRGTLRDDRACLYSPYPPHFPFFDPEPSFSYRPTYFFFHYLFLYLLRLGPLYAATKFFFFFQKVRRKTTPPSLPPPRVRDLDLDFFSIFDVLERKIVEWGNGGTRTKKRMGERESALWGISGVIMGAGGGKGAE